MFPGTKVHGNETSRYRQRYGMDFPTVYTFVSEWLEMGISKLVKLNFEVSVSNK